MASMTGYSGLATCLLLVLAGILPVPVVSDTSIWTFHIDEGPAPPPSQRPPFSAGARYNPSLLKYQIPGIAGGYVGFVLLLWFCVLTFGRRLRKEAQSCSALGVEMVKPLKQTLDPSPVSPSSMTSTMWQKWKGSPSSKTEESPAQRSIVSFDDHILEKDRAQRQEEMERLYAAVIAQHAKAPRNLANPVATSPPQPSAHVRTLSSSSTRNFSQPLSSPRFENPPTFFESQTYMPPSPPAVPIMSPQRAYHPNNEHTAEINYNMSYPALHSPTDHAYGLRSGTMMPQSLPSGPRSGPIPVPSHSRQASASSLKSKSGQGNFRNLQISSPIPKPVFPEPQDQYYEMDTRTPMSPHYIPTNPGRPPSPPSDSRAETPIEDDTDENYRDTNPFYEGYEEHSDSIIHAYGGEDLDRPREAVPKKPQTLTVPKLSITTPQHSSNNDPSLRPPQLRNASSPASAGAATNSLPFRAIYPPPQQTQPSQAYTSTSPGPMKTTFLSPRKDHFLPGGMNPIGAGGVPNSAALLSAGLATPYSPYMPFSPMTPVTPRLTTRRDRRALEREEARVAATADDRVQDDEELWGDGW